MATILLIALILARDAPPAPEFAPRSREAAAMVPSVPFLIVVLGAETAVLPHVPGETWLQTTPPLALAVILFGVSLLAFVRTGRSVARSIEQTHTEKVRQAVVRRKPVASGPKLVVWPLLFVVSYPLLIRFFPIELDAFVARLEGWSAALVVLAINALFLAAVWLTVAFGIDRFAESVRRQWRETAEGIAVALARGLPLLLVFTVFFALTQETWEVAAEEEAMGAYFGLLGSLVGLTIVFILATSALEVRRSSRFDDERAVKDAALRPQETSPASEPPGEPFATELEAIEDGALSDRLSLQRAGWINAALVLTAYHPGHGCRRAALLGPREARGAARRGGRMDLRRRRARVAGRGPRGALLLAPALDTGGPHSGCLLDVLSRRACPIQPRAARAVLRRDRARRPATPVGQADLRPIHGVTSGRRLLERS
jgi:hypothetical protein